MRKRSKEQQPLRPDPARSSGSIINSDFYPSGLPVRTQDELQAIAGKMQPGCCPTAQEIFDVCHEQQRTLKKIRCMNATARPDKEERIESAGATLAISFNLALHSLTMIGRDRRQQQQNQAKKPRARGDPFDPMEDAIHDTVNGEPDRTTREVLIALMNFRGPEDRHLEILQIEIKTDRIRQCKYRDWNGQETILRFQYCYRNRQGKAMKRWMSYAAFATRVSRQRKNLIRGQ